MTTPRQLSTVHEPEEMKNEKVNDVKSQTHEQLKDHSDKRRPQTSGNNYHGTLPEEQVGR